MLPAPVQPQPPQPKGEKKKGKVKKRKAESSADDEVDEGMYRYLYR
jgi:hypothetical protein